MSSEWIAADINGRTMDLVSVRVRSEGADVTVRRRKRKKKKKKGLTIHRTGRVLVEAEDHLAETARGATNVCGAEQSSEVR